MNQFFLDTFAPLYRYIKKKEYRTFVNLLTKYGSLKRFEEKTIKFLDYTFLIPDSPSFLDQFKTIFVDEIYKFETEKKAPLIFDCGANIGISALYFKRNFPDCKITAFEADPKIAKVLENNLKRNNIEGVEVINKAIWIDNNGVSFGQEGGDGGSIFIQENSTKVDSIRLRNLIESEREIDFLKMDIEGAEVAVLNDCKDILDKINNLFIEYHSYSDMKQDLDQVLQILTLNNFRYYLQTVNYNKFPFLKKNLENSMDLQVNIFAFKI